MAQTFLKLDTGVTGTLPTSNYVDSGKVLQVVSNTASTTKSTTSTSFVATGFSVTITPSSSSSKILLTGQFNMYNVGNGQALGTLYRGGFSSGTDINPGSFSMWQMHSSSDNSIGTCALNFLDTPSTTSATTYEVALRTTLGTCTLSVNSDPYTLTAMEIEA
jgi:hypothetical protein